MSRFAPTGNPAFDEAREGGVIDTMIGFPQPRDQQAKQYDFIRRQAMDAETQDMEFPAQYMFKGVPHYDRVDDPVDMLVALMNQHGITKALTGLPTDGPSKRALEDHPDRFVASCNVDPNRGMDAVRALDEAVRVHGAKAAHCWGTGLIPQVPLDDKKMYPVYAKCIELDIPIFVYAGVPGPRIRYEPQYVGLLVLSGPSDRDAPRRRAVDRAHGEAVVEVAEPLLLDVRVRAQALQQGHRRLREHARR